MSAIKEIKKDGLVVEVYATRKEMGDAAGKEAGKIIRELLSKKETINMIFAAAPSQNETLAALVKEKGIDWRRVRAFHMDEYIGLPLDAPQGFGNFLDRAIFSLLPFKEIHYLRSTKDSATICKEYEELLLKNPIDIVLLGIGENGHIAFNDPHVALFNDPKLVKIVDLDDKCRLQQVHDGCFEKFEDVPKYAVTLTIPELFSASYLICTVPASTKAEAVRKTINDQISEECPATIMRRHPHAKMYVDKEAGKNLL